MTHRTTLAALLILLTTSCGGSSGMSGPTMSSGVGDEQAGDDLSSRDVLERDQLTDHAEVKHVLIGWRDLADMYRGEQDPRGQKRTRAEADALARQILDRAKKGEPFEKLMIDTSDDPGSAKSGTAYEVAPDAPLVPEFKRLALRLKVGEIGAVQSRFGWHIMKRVK